ncbi:hypothetical protein BDN72DRAFT_957660 [Pluteus cervinus]|uniref:Uncharacterized protein n=1 Tax=Pluteus cervinus TaxID=181527 RepID=A0ACD3B4N9_9AGAR|nr:hypothetical protein BDN72DRAFT_957660 [Pluteus cervinus]
MDPVLSLSIHGLTQDAAYRKLDEEIASLQSRLCSLRTLRNALSPICKIPTELLSKIFTHTQEPDRSSLYDGVDLATRFVITWVCRHWRDIALTSANLWTVISSQKMNPPLFLDVFEELLTRSRNMGLSICLSRPTIPALKVCMSHMSRIQHLRLEDSLVASEADELLNQPALLLTSLELHNMALRSAFKFSEVFPNLEHLVIESTPFITPSPLITPVLTTLRIVNPILSVGVDYILGLLPSFQRLTELVLSQCFGAQNVIHQQFCRDYVHVYSHSSPIGRSQLCRPI